MTDNDAYPRFGSLFSGIGGIDLGLERAGMQPAWQCEIDPDAQAVLKQHWPDVPCYPDVETLNDPPAVDVLCGGFPCQDVSVAGRRAGLAGTRSGLFHQFMRVAARLAPRWLVIENVPGLLSSNDGKDMGVVLDSLAELGYGWAYRVLDAQYFGVAQRRRRVFIVGCFGDPAAAFKVLFEPESGHGDPPPRRTAGTRVAALTANGVGTCGAADNQGQAGHLIPTLTENGMRGKGRDGSPSLIPAFIPFHSTQDPISGDVFPAMGTGNRQGCGSLAVAYSTKLHNTESNQAGKFYEEYTPSLQHDSPPPAVAYPLAIRGRDQGVELEIGDEGVYNALRAGDGGGSSRGQMVAYNPYRTLEKDGSVTSGWAERPVVNALHGPTGNQEPLVPAGMQVRRLTPTECERLQGFPDGWTAGRTDSARYRCLGNAVCVPVAEWIGRRLATAAPNRAPCGDTHERSNHDHLRGHSFRR